MGGRRVPRGAIALLLVAGVGLGGCSSGGGAASPRATPVATASPAATTAGTPSATPSPTSTPDPVPARPRDASEARASADAFLKAGGQLCTSAFKRKWGVVTCYQGDFDGDKADDVAVLLVSAAGDIPSPGLILLKRSGRAATETFATIGDVDLTPRGAALVVVEDFNGDGRLDIAYLQTTCGGANCQSRYEVQAWDGTAWRDIGTGAPGFDNADRVAVTGAGRSAKLVVHSGTLASAGAGPARTATATYAVVDGRYTLSESKPDEPVYLIHAILDGDELFLKGDFPAAVTAYQAALATPGLRDWREEAAKGAGRPALRGYALFRIAVAQAALGAPPVDVRAAFDALVNGSTDQLFLNVMETFRRAYFEGGEKVHSACVEVTRYLSQPEVAPFVREAFDYGFANPRRSPADVCPL